jgi:hypothetical protein
MMSNIKSMESLLLNIASKNEKFLIFLRKELNTIIIEQRICTAIFRILLSKIDETFYNSSAKEKMTRIFNDVNTDISFEKFNSHNNDAIYVKLMHYIIKELNNPNINMSSLISLFRELEDQKTHNAIVTEVKNFHEGHKLVKGVRVKETGRGGGAGVKIIEQPGQKLTNMEKVTNLANLNQESKLSLQKAMILQFVNKYNSIHKMKMITSSDLHKINELWTAIFAKHNKPHRFIAEYIMYAFKLIRPDITQVEINGTLEKQEEANKSNINNFYTIFFNENRNENFKKYAAIHKNNVLGYTFDVSKLMYILKNYKPLNHAELSPKLLNEIESFQSLSELTKFLDSQHITGNIIYRKYKDVEGVDSIKLTQIYAKNLLKST